ncbi:hypothetical protein LEN26_021019 [Aphanomyces euteiches]|nr:hypothetical protein LEN26_021019 [Aphanomyces euteiches]KAH9117080.1 hypothetical protein AeMF1_009047 [Aphanomyces euteiches]
MQHPDCWLFGGVDRTTKKWFGVLTFQDQTKPTLTALIKKHIRPGTMIMSDKFGSYVSANGRHNLANDPNLSDMNYGHMWVNHSENFVNPSNGAHTQRIEGLWEVQIKHFIKSMRGVHRSLLQSYLDEFLWRSWYFPTSRSGKMYFKGLILGIRNNEQ